MSASDFVAFSSSENGETLAITINITGEDISNIEDWYWSLHVQNFDSAHTPECSFKIEYGE